MFWKGFMIRYTVLTLSVFGLFVLILIPMSLLAKPIYFIYSQSVLGSVYIGDEVFHKVLKVIGYVMAPISLAASIVVNYLLSKRL